MRWPWHRAVERPARYAAAPLPPPDPKLLEWSAQGAPVPQGPQPGCDQEKLRITKVGVMRLTPQGQIYTQGWQFSSFIRWAPSGRYDTSVALDGKMAGWHMRELHAIAHGSPCDCGVTELVEREFPRG